jgi:hypothetical protein
MCRSIRPLRGRAAPPATDGDVHDAARQFVRKIAATRAPAVRDTAAFDAAVGEIAAATARLLAAMGAPAIPGPPTPPSAWPPRPQRPSRGSPGPGNPTTRAPAAAPAPAPSSAAEGSA